jgi:hypothetical protein
VESPSRLVLFHSLRITWRWQSEKEGTFRYYLIIVTYNQRTIGQHVKMADQRLVCPDYFSVLTADKFCQVQGSTVPHALHLMLCVDLL